MARRRSETKPLAGRYEVVSGTSTRRSINPRSSEYGEWVNYRPGDIATNWPRHAPVAEWVASGHWKEYEA